MNRREFLKGLFFGAAGVTAGQIVSSVPTRLIFDMGRYSHRTLKAGYTHELSEDLANLHGLKTSEELANILAEEILKEVNREIVRTFYRGPIEKRTESGLITLQY